MIAIAGKNLTIKEVLSWAEGYLNGYGVADPKAETEYLLSHLLNCKRSGLYLKHDKSLAIDEFQRFMDWLNRRIAMEPSQYIIGEQEFWGLAFKVTRDVLIPRPETEILVEEAIKTVSSKSEVVSGNNNIQLTTHDSRFTILDLCTGSGCIAVSLAKEIPDCHIYAVDVSEKALYVARENAERHGGVADRINFLQGDLFGPLKCLKLVKRVDLIVSNPPYIAKTMMKDLQPEIRDYEPEIAVYAGEDGLDFYRRIISEAPKYLAKDGCILLEMGYGQAEEIKKLIEQHKAFEHIDIKKDFAGIDRVIKAQIAG